jgi:hypothetical protein
MSAKGLSLKDIFLGLRVKHVNMKPEMKRQQSGRVDKINPDGTVTVDWENGAGKGDYEPEDLVKDIKQ